MNNSNAAARKRRAPPVSEPITRPVNTQLNTSQAQSQAQANQSQTAGHTLPQVISIINNRLLFLENQTKETQNNSKDEDSAGFNEIQAEYENRFDLIIREIDSIKEIVIKLQSYTMDVNKILVEEHTASKIILEKEKEFHSKILEQTDKTHKTLIDIVVANYKEELNEYKEKLNEYKDTNKELLLELKQIMDLNIRLSTIGEHTTHLNEFNKQKQPDKISTNIEDTADNAAQQKKMIMEEYKNTVDDTSDFLQDIDEEPENELKELNVDTNENINKPKNRRYKMKQ